MHTQNVLVLARGGSRSSFGRRLPGMTPLLAVLPLGLSGCVTGTIEAIRRTWREQTGAQSVLRSDPAATVSF